MKTEVTPGKKEVGKPCKVILKDLDNSNASNHDPQSNKNNASDDKVQIQTFTQSIVKDSDINLVGNPKVTSEHLDDISADDNVSRPSPSIPIKSPISDIANRPKQWLRLSRQKAKIRCKCLCLSN